MQAIIFLAPLAFNLTLEEDPKVNRLEDSITLWREVCTNGLLSKTTLILFLNKVRAPFSFFCSALSSSCPDGPDNHLRARDDARARGTADKFRSETHPRAIRTVSNLEGSSIPCR